MCWYSGGKELGYVLEKNSVFISSPALNLLEPNWNHTLGPCTSWATLAAPRSVKRLLGYCFVPGHDVSLLVVGVCPRVLFRNTLVHRSARVAVRAGVQSWVRLCWSLVGGEMCEQEWEGWGGSGNPPMPVCDPQWSNWKHLKSPSIHPGLCERWVTAGGYRAIWTR